MFGDTYFIKTKQNHETNELKSWFSLPLMRNLRQKNNPHLLDSLANIAQNTLDDDLYEYTVCILYLLQYYFIK